MFLKNGDIIQVKTKNGYAYLWCVFVYQKLPKYGNLVKVFNQKFEKPLNYEEAKAFVLGKEDYFTFLLPSKKGMLSQGFEVVFNYPPTPENSYENLPLMRIFDTKLTNGKHIPSTIRIVRPGSDPKNPGSREVYKQELPENYQNISTFTLVNEIELKRRLEKNYTSLGEYQAMLSGDLKY